jgi:hypothetical protein
VDGREALLFFCKCFERRFQAKYLPSFGRDGKLMKSVLAVHGDRFGELLERFFDDDDEWVQQAGYTVPVFYSRINKYISASTGGRVALCRT